MNWMMMKSAKSFLMTFSVSCRNVVSDFHFSAKYASSSSSEVYLIFFPISLHIFISPSLHQLIHNHYIYHMLMHSDVSKGCEFVVFDLVTAMSFIVTMFPGIKNVSYISINKIIIIIIYNI